VRRFDLAIRMGAQQDSMSTPMEDRTGAGMLDVLGGFIQELRAAGLPVSLTENLDAMQAVQHIPLDDREAFKYALAATLVKNNAHWKAFETVFEVYFAMRGSRFNIDRSTDTDEANLEQMLDELMGAGQDGQGGSMEGLTAEQLAEMLYRALMQGDEALLRALARQSVTRFAGMEPGRPVGGTYYLYRTLRLLDLDNVLERMLQDAGRRRHDPPGTTPHPRRIRIPSRHAPQANRSGDPPATGRRPGRRGHGQDPPQTAARRHRLHARHP
jgi:uncharacterized protein with von Willebrand factor type A (vWA) domain